MDEQRCREEYERIEEVQSQTRDRKDENRRQQERDQEIQGSFARQQQDCHQQQEREDESRRRQKQEQEARDTVAWQQQIDRDREAACQPEPPISYHQEPVWQPE